MLRRLLIIFSLLFALAGGAFGYYLYVVKERQKMEHQYDHLIDIAAREQKVDPYLIRAVIWRESRFKRFARGTSGERGLMQLMPATAREWAKKNNHADFKEDDLFNEYVNIQAGVYTLARGLQKWADRDNPIPFALAEYNAGRSRVHSWIDPGNPTSARAFYERIDIPSTRRYVWIIERKYQEYLWREQNPNWWWWPYEFLNNLTSSEDDPTVTD
ncbi:MAG TPA: lytic transglycosylase domain-containing protein [Candidatus Methylacidiphilales bacterium]|nr:lytic transglycosylase domain-containing protein [Candidatus Methylacidiphilales bacterium]